MKIPAVITRALGVGAVLGPLAIGLPVLAQEAGSQEFSQTQIESFASAALGVNEVRDKWMVRLQSAESEDEMTEMREKAGAEMVTAIESNGLTVDEYNAIAEAGMQNPALHERIIELMNEGE